MSVPYHNKALPQGAVLREWRLEAVLGVGGFGIVYRGRGLYFDELVAIKEYFPGAISDRLDQTTVAPNDSGSEDIYALGLNKFVEEAKVLWNLSKPERHPNIVSVKSLFEIHGTAYMVMDFESGVSLSQMLKEGHRFDEKSLLAIIRPIAQGLDRAHRSGVLHRDIKPANILVDPTGRPVLIDFGSARFDSGQATSTKVTFYTPPYAAIEQYVKTYPQGPWTDIYALGVSMYECVAGEKPPEVLERLHGEVGAPLASRDWPGFSSAFIRAVDAAMAIKPAERPQSISQWLQMFEATSGPMLDEATRIAVKPAAVLEAPAPSVPEVEGQAAPDGDLAAIKAEATQGADRGARFKLKLAALILAGAAGVAAIGLVLFNAAPQSSQPISALAPVTTIPRPSGAPLAADMAELIAHARRIARPQREVAALVAARDKIAALEREHHQVAATPDGAARASALDGELLGVAKAAAETQRMALAREERAMLRVLRQNPAWLATKPQGGPVAMLKLAKNDLDAALAAVAAATDGPALIAASRRALVAYEGFSGAHRAAQGEFLAAQRTALAEIEASAKQAGGQVIAAAAKAKPWVFASKTQKEAYRLAQDNAARAREVTAELTTLGQAALSSTNLETLNASTVKASALRDELKALLAATAAAAARTGDKGGVKSSTP